MLRSFLRITLLAAWLTGLALQAMPGPGHGRLVIAGGGVSDAYEEIYSVLMASRLAGKPIGIVAASLDNPGPSVANGFNRTFGAGSAIYLDITPENGRANDPAIVAQIQNCGGIFFWGGSQTRHVQALRNSNGTRTPALQAIWDLYAAGAPIGGTSAGAAIMSDPMISAGTSADALLLGPGTTSVPSSQRGVTLRRGLGFHSDVLYCQHHLERSRFGRLLAAVAKGNVGTDLGIGIAEDTAVVVDHAAGTGRIVGRKGALVVDVSGIQLGVHGEMSGAIVHYLDRGDTFDFTQRAIAPAPGKVLWAPTRAPGPIDLVAWNTNAIYTLITRLADTRETSLATAIDPNFDVVFRKTAATEVWRQPAEASGERATWTVTHLEVSVVRREGGASGIFVHDYPFDDPAGTPLAGTLNVAQPGTTWSGNWGNSFTTGDGRFRIQRNDGAAQNRRIDVGALPEIDELYLVAEFAGWNMANVTNASLGEPNLRLHFMNGLSADTPDAVTAGFRLAHVPGAGVTLEANAGGTAAPGGQSKAAEVRFPAVLSERLILGTRYHRRNHNYTVYYRVGEGAWVEFFTGNTSGVRDAVSVRFSTAGDSFGGGQNFIDIDRIYVSSALPPEVRTLAAKQPVMTESLDLDYSLADFGDRSWQVALRYSLDGGESWEVAAALAGDAGEGIAPGLERRLTWSAGEELDPEFEGEVLVRLEVGMETGAGIFQPWAQSAVKSAFIDLRRFPEASYFFGYGGARPYDLSLEPDGVMRFSLFVLPPYRYTVEGSTDLMNWTPVVLSFPGGETAGDLRPTVPGPVIGLRIPASSFSFFRVIQQR